MSIRQRLLQLLADGKWHSGEELAEQLGVTRTAVWKQLEGLRNELGLELHAVKGRGYRLPEGLELLDAQHIKAGLSPEVQAAIPEIEICETLESTSSHLMAQPFGSLKSGHVCLAERQTGGRGRHGRQWISPFASSVYLSLCWHYALTPAELSGVSLVAGLAVVRALRMLGIEGAGLKWPNDVLYEERKLAGLLLEVSGEQSGPSRVVLGLGLNVRLSESVGREIDQPWIDLRSLPGGEAISRNRLVSELLMQLVAVLGKFETSGLEAFIEEWKSHDLYHGRLIRLKLGQRIVEGVHQGIDANGALLLQTPEGVQAYHGGEVSLRPVE